MQISVRKRSNGWEYRIELAKIDGKRKQKSKGGFKTKAEALRAGTAALNEYNNAGIVFEKSEISFSDFIDLYIENYQKINCKSWKMSKYYLDSYAKPTLGEYKLVSLSTQPIVIQRLINTLNLAPATLKTLKKFLSGAFKYAIYPCNYIASNPCRFVKIPKEDVISSNKRFEKNMYIVSEEEFSDILEIFKNTYHYEYLLIDYYTGMRKGELFGLTWDCVDFENRTININKQLQRVDGSWIITGTKHNSDRVIKVNDIVIDTLRRLKKEQLERRLFYGEFWNENDFVFKKEDGGNLIVSIFNCALRKIKQKYPLFHPHTLRHTHGTRLIEAGVNPKAVMQRLGHKDIQTTLNLYVKSTEKMEDDIINALNKSVVGK